MKSFKMAWASLFLLLASACGNDPEPAATAQDEAPLTVIPIVDYTYGSAIRRSWLMLTADGTVRLHEQHCGGCIPVTSIDTVPRSEMAALRQHIEQLAHAPQMTGRGRPATLGSRSGRLVVRTQASKEVNVHRIDGTEPTPGDYPGITYATGPAAAAIRDFVNALVAMPMPSVE